MSGMPRALISVVIDVLPRIREEVNRQDAARKGMNMDADGNKPRQGWRRTAYEIVFESDTPAGEAFDLLLIASIVLNVAVIMLDSVASIRAEHQQTLYILAWAFTILFTVEYVLRLLLSMAHFCFAG